MSRITIELRPQRGCEQPSLHTLRRYLVGELDQEKYDSVVEHLDTCLDCAALVAEMRSDEAAFRTTMPFERFAADLERRRSQKGLGAGLQAWWKGLRWPAAAVASAAAAALVLMLVLPEPESEIRLKGGGAGLGFLIKEGEGVRRGIDGERLVPGDRIQFLVRADNSARSMVLVGVDGRGAVTVYAVDTFDGQVKGDPKPQLLPGSVILDDAIGQERFFAVFSKTLDAESLHQRAQSAALSLVASGADLGAIEQLPLEGEDVVQTSIGIVKVEQ